MHRRSLLLACVLQGCLAIAVRAQAPIHSFHGNSAGDWYGTSVSSAGDVDGDRIDDVIVGAPLDDPSGRDSGSAQVRSGATGAVLHQFFGSHEGDEYGYSVGDAGDVNADGFDDVIVGIPGDDNQGGIDAGGAELRDGRTGALLAFFNGYTGGARLGTSVSGAGDMDADGHDDVLLGAPFDEDAAQFVDCGSVRVVSGRTLLNLAVWYGFGPLNQFGWSVSDVGDVDGDGHDDVIVGEPFGDHYGQMNWGLACVLSGKTHTLLHSFMGAAYDSQFGTSVSGAGDVDGDGVPDVIVGAPNDDAGGADAGRATIFSGANGDIVLDIVGPMPRAKLGSAVSDLGDVNGDGHDDVLVGAPHHTFGSGSYSGQVWLFSGSSGAWIRYWTGQAGDRFGASLDRVGNLVGDATPELVIGARMHDGAGKDAGLAVVHRAE